MCRDISVVIPTYNSSQFIRETLKSVFAQARRPGEIIVVDDASTDETPAIVEAMAAETTVPLRLIQLPKRTGGPATPMNVGIEAARGEYIAILDHDDLMLPHKLAAQGNVLDNHPSLEMVLGDYEFLIEDHVCQRTGVWPWQNCSSSDGSVGNPTLHILQPGISRCALLTGNLLGLSCSNYFFRKALWHRLSGFSCDADISTDYDFLLRAAGRPIGWLESILFAKRQHDSNLCQPTPQNMLLAMRIRGRWLRSNRRMFGNGLRGQAIWRAAYASVLREHATWYFQNGQGKSGLVKLVKAAFTWPFFNPWPMIKTCLEYLLGPRVYNSARAVVRTVFPRRRQNVQSEHNTWKSLAF